MYFSHRRTATRNRKPSRLHKKIFQVFTFFFFYAAFWELPKCERKELGLPGVGKDSGDFPGVNTRFLGDSSGLVIRFWIFSWPGHTISGTAPSGCMFLGVPCDYVQDIGNLPGT